MIDCPLEDSVQECEFDFDRRWFDEIFDFERVQIETVKRRNENREIKEGTTTPLSFDEFFIGIYFQHRKIVIRFLCIPMYYLLI